MRLRQSERGQAIILFVGIFTVILVMAAIVVDFGLWFAERRSAQRGADLAAAAGAQDLPLAPDLAFTSACAWAIENGFDAADADVEVFVNVSGQDGLSTERDCGLLPEAPPTPACDPQCDTVRVTVTKGAPRLFTGIFGLGVDVGAVASAGLTSGGGIGGVGADQTVLLIDAQGWMIADGAMDRAKAEANNFVDTIAGSAGARVGYAPYTHCIQEDIAGTYPCVSREIIVDLDPANDVEDLHAAIDGTVPIPLGKANLCLPLLEAWRMFDQAEESGRRAIIILSNGDNRYSHTSFWDRTLNYPPVECRTDPSNQNFRPAGGRCDELAVLNERVLDRLTLEQAELLKAPRDLVPGGFDAEIFVIGLDVCGPDDGQTRDSPGYCEAIFSESDISDNSTPDSISDQRLLKCVASSPDHYFNVSLGDPEWPFEEIASEIVSRSLVQ